MGANSKNPDQQYPNAPTSTQSPMPLNIPDPSIRGVSFDQLLNNRGIRFIHKRAAPCPNLKSVEDNNHDPNCTVCDGNGVLYYCEKEVWGTFISNSLEKNFEQQGMWEIGTAVVSLPAYYPDGSVAEFNTYDQLVIPDFSTRLWQIVNYEPRTGGITPLRYDVDTVDVITTVRNGVRHDFIEGTDFNIVNGQITWVTGREPSYNNVEEIGEVLSIVYHANPVYNVLQQLRELRVTQELINGQKTARRLPQQILVKRDFYHTLPETEA